MIADCHIENANFHARLTHYKQEKLKQFTITEEKQALAIQEQLLKEANGILTVSHVEKKQRKRNPAPPFITSTLQQEAARKLNFTARKTMMVAQQLYEGIELGTGTVGLITYMRTDSVHLADEAVKDIRQFIIEKYVVIIVPSKSGSLKQNLKMHKKHTRRFDPLQLDAHPIW